MFKKLLIANRGEIALRIMDTAKKMGIKTVAIYSEADTNALHVKAADEAVYVGPSPSTESYLNIPAIVRAIQQTGADAVHPGYGFLSEKSNFAEAVAKAGASFVGPPIKAIETMGDKIASKKLAKEAGVSCVPGTDDAVTSSAEAKKIAGEIGYPVIIKAAAGGGGKGMRVARSEEELLAGVKYAASEAKSSFSDARVFIEKYIENPRHIEIQVLADTHGNVVTLGERECSIQRRHQKIIEEAPSGFLSDKMRKEMSDQAAELARKVGYHSAGTVEFIADPQGGFYFLEMNTRLQVEHRVTELITGLDLVEQMLRVASGETLAFTQDEVRFSGWAFESRIYAEDPKRNFLPSTGRITRYEEPNGGSLIDSGVTAGSEVSMFYDPMIAKLCTHGSTREQAVDRMQEALSAYVIEGIGHNIGFLQAIYSHEKFKKGDISTNFIAQEYPEGFSGAEINSEITETFIGAATFLYLRDAERMGEVSGQLPGRARALGQRWVISVGEQEYPIYVRRKDYGYDITHDDRLIAVRSTWEHGRRLFQGTINGKPVSLQLRFRAEGYRLTYAGAEAHVIVRAPHVAQLAIHMPEVSDTASAHELRAPIAGLVIGVRVKEGERVKAGQELVVIEAMKMENVIHAERDVTIAELHVGESESVQADQLMIEFVR